MRKKRRRNKNGTRTEIVLIEYQIRVHSTVQSQKRPKSFVRHICRSFFFSAADARGCVVGADEQQKSSRSTSMPYAVHRPLCVRSIFECTMHTKQHSHKYVYAVHRVQMLYDVCVCVCRLSSLFRKKKTEFIQTCDGLYKFLIYLISVLRLFFAIRSLPTYFCCCYFHILLLSTRFVVVVVALFSLFCWIMMIIYFIII